MIADGALGLPGGKRTEWTQLGDDSRHLLRGARARDLNRRSDRKAVQEIFACVKRQPLLPARLDREYRLTGGTFSPISATITLTAPSTGELRMVLARCRSILIPSKNANEVRYLKLTNSKP
jgi:hypothetical protein